MYKFQGFNSEFSKSNIVILPVGYDSTTSYLPGTREGPSALLKASLNLEFYDIETNQEISKIYTLEEMNRIISPKKMIHKVMEKIEWIIKHKKFPIMIGGEHSLSIGFAKALKKFYKKFSVLHIDAHADLRDSYEGSKFSHACTIRRIYEITPNIISIGIRSMSLEEARFLRKSKIKHLSYKKINQIIKNLNQYVYITLDLDGLDPSILPGVGTPEPGGINYNELINILRIINQKKKVIGFDIMELCPIPGQIVSEFTAAKILQKFIAYYNKFNS